MNTTTFDNIIYELKYQWIILLSPFIFILCFYLIMIYIIIKQNQLCKKKRNSNILPL